MLQNVNDKIENPTSNCNLLAQDQIQIQKFQFIAYFRVQERAVLSYLCLERAIDAHTSRCDVSSCMLQNQLVHGFGVHVPNPNRSSFIGLGGSRMINTKHRQNLPLHQICSQQKSAQDSQITVNQCLLDLPWIVIELQRSGNSPSLVFFVSVAIEESPPSFAWSSPKGAPLFFLLKLSLKTLFETQLFVFLLIHLPHFPVVSFFF